VVCAVEEARREDLRFTHGCTGYYMSSGGDVEARRNTGRTGWLRGRWAQRTVGGQLECDVVAGSRRRGGRIVKVYVYEWRLQD
jgi:hypothetical protein